MPRSQAQSQREAEERELREIVVFTGDLVGSSKLGPEALGEAMRALGGAAEDFARAWGPRGWDPRFTAYRGDGWQCLAPEGRLALRAALVFRARLGALGRQFDTRVSIAVGRGRLTDEPRLSVAAGPAFELSGRGLDGMEHARRFALAWESPPADGALLRAVLALADEVSRNWTPGQARVFALLLLDRQRPNQAALARELDITQQTVAAHLAGGGDWALQEALRAVEGPE